MAMSSLEPTPSLPSAQGDRGQLQRRVFAACGTGTRRAAPRGGCSCGDRLHQRSAVRQSATGRGPAARRARRGCRSARRGTYRTVYRIDQSTHSVFVLRIAHRRDVYST
ncbi:type II toxin-antitoxin system RelE family toxin [Candidatus Neomicrothrix sp.]|uniref:type II toxin-antitoxin system RelE family toxin n=1 Tax=Candidatus Neomicrothrix sp. TaxID=2719034 RepID=UPI003CD0CC61